MTRPGYCYMTGNLSIYMGVFSVTKHKEEKTY